MFCRKINIIRGAFKSFFKITLKKTLCQHLKLVNKTDENRIYEKARLKLFKLL